jgi:hypothetical protein
MANSATGQHVLSDELLRFFEGELEVEREESIAEHLEGCDECRDRALEVGETFAAMKEWTAETHGEAYRAHLQGAVQRSLARAARAQGNPAIAARLRNWLERGEGQTEPGLGLHLDSAGRAPDALGEVFEVLVRPEAALLRNRVSPVGRQMRLRTDLVDQEVDMLRSDDFVSPFEENLDIPAFLHRGGRPSVRMEADGAVVVEKGRPEIGRQAPLVLLIDSEERHEPAVQELVPTSRGVLEARFESPQPGNYLVLFEPRSPVDDRARTSRSAS